MAAWEPEEDEREYRTDPLTKLMKRLYRWLFPDDPKEQKRGFHLGREKNFLCDTCRFSYGNACSQPDRPNAITCADYKKA